MVGFQEFLGGLVVRMQRSHHCDPGSIPDLGTEIPHQATAHHDQKTNKQTNKQAKKDGGFLNGETDVQSANYYHLYNLFEPISMLCC